MVLSSGADPSTDGWEADALPGDVLEAVATYEVSAGVYTDCSGAASATFVVAS